MSKWVVDIHGDIEGDYEIIKKYEEPKTDVLDKIRAEIIENSIEDYEYHGCGTDELIIETSQVLKIINKYKAEIKTEQALAYADQDTLMPAT